MRLDPEQVARLRLIRTDRIGPATYLQLFARFGSARAATAALPDLVRASGAPIPSLVSDARLEREAMTVERIGARYLFLGDPDYPSLLAQIDVPPPVLIVAGDPGLAARPTVALVGARNASAAACRFARSLARSLGEAGLVVVSGLARGIDTAAHDGALETGTIAVVAGGIDVVYPPENAARQRAISARGLLVSEQPPGLEPRSRHFPHRNRIIAGLAGGIVVVEAAPRSGSLITARHAGDYGREVMAVPGSPADPRAQGCNLLIRDGATLVQSVEDVLEAIRPSAVPSRRRDLPGQRPIPVDEPGDDARRVVADLLGPTPVSIDELVRQADLPAATVQSVLLELEIGGRLERHAGGRVALA